MKSVSCSYLFLIWVMIRKNIPSFPRTMNSGVINTSQNATTLSFGIHLAQMQLRVSHYYGDVILHFTKSGGMNKPDRYLPMREAEFVALLGMVDEINKQIKKTKKIARKERRNLDDESDINFTQVPLPPMQKKRPNKHPAPSSDSNDSSSCGEEAVEGLSMGKGGGKKLKLAKKKKAKKMEKENDLVGSSQGSDSQLSEAGDK